MKGIFCGRDGTMSGWLEGIPYERDTMWKGWHVEWVVGRDTI